MLRLGYAYAALMLCCARVLRAAAEVHKVVCIGSTG